MRALPTAPPLAFDPFLAPGFLAAVADFAGRVDDALRLGNVILQNCKHASTELHLLHKIAM
jgi:hypothetical protein